MLLWSSPGLWRTALPSRLTLMKRNMNCAESSGLAELLDMEAAHQVQTGRTEDHREAAKAFVEKRAPVFVGR